MDSVSDTKLICRKDFECRSSSDERDPSSTSFEVRYNERLKQLYPPETLEKYLDFESTDHDNGSASAIPSRNDDEEVYTFRLFAKTILPTNSTAPESTTDTPNKINLRSPTPVNPEPSFLTPSRPKEYYFTGPPSPKQLTRFHYSAVTTSQILANLKTKWPGSSLPWRVTTIPQEPHQTPLTPPPSSITSTKKRSGKKRRIAIRQNAIAESARKVELQKRQEVKEAAEREKRMRRNREKKVKRKERDKGRKEGGKGGGGGEGG
ncbi:hypothetical protein ACLMJK_007783 [Lecanora helva]